MRGVNNKSKLIWLFMGADRREEAEDGRRKTEDGRRKAEGGRRKAEDGRRKTEDGRRKTEDGRRKTEDGRRKTEDGRRKGPLAVGFWFSRRRMADNERRDLTTSKKHFRLMPSASCLPPKR
jgi:hypothetical protein